MTPQFCIGAGLFGLGTTVLALDTPSRSFSFLRPVSAIALGIGLTLLSSAAYADQFKQATDNARIECEVSRRELTRIALVGDQFASVSKVSSGNPYSDFAVSNEPVRGDIYLSVPPSFAGADVNFFATSKKGYVYKFACKAVDIEAQQVFVANPALASTEAADWESDTQPGDAAIRLIKAMAADETPPGFTVRQATGLPARVGTIEVRIIATYQGASLHGQVLKLTNSGLTDIRLTESEIAPKAALAVSLTANSLASGASATAFVVTRHAGE